MLRNIRQKAVKTVGTGILVVASVEFTTKLPSEGRSSQLYHDISDQIVTPFIRKILNPEDAHNTAIYFVKNGFAPTFRSNKLEASQKVCLKSKSNSLVFPSCIGLAAGFDKDGVAIKGLQELGFGFVEIGSVTPKPQPGNPKPRMFRLEEDLGIINRFGFNSVGLEAAEHNLKAFRRGNVAKETEPSKTDDYDFLNAFGSFVSSAAGIIWKFAFPPKAPIGPSLLGINLGKNKTSTHETEDYEIGIEKLGEYADYLVVNISSPNTPGLRNLQQSEPIRRLLKAAIEKRNKLTNRPPLFVKIAPDLTLDEMKDIAAAVMENNADGILVTNTSNQRPDTLLSKRSSETGGLSGLPIRDLSTECIRKMYKLTEGKVFLIGIGGVGTGQDAYEKLKAGASVVQIYSRMVYEGPGVVSRIRKELAELMEQNGQKSLEDVVGLDHDDIFWKHRMERINAGRSKENKCVEM